MYYDMAVWKSENNFSRIHAQWEPDKEWQVVEVNDGNAQVDEDYTTKPWVGNPSSLYDDDAGTRVRLHNNVLNRGGLKAYQTFRIIPNTGSSLHLLYVRLKATIPDYGYFRLEYTRSDGTVITALGNTKDYDGNVRVADDVVEVRLVAEGEDKEYWNFVTIDFYMMRPYFVARSRVYGKLPDGREIVFCIPKTIENGIQDCRVQTSDGEQALMTVSSGHQFASPFKIKTSKGEKALVVYE